jgi:DNA-binding IclR family transcriptional regulator
MSRTQKFDNEKTEAEVLDLLKNTPMAASTDYVAHNLNVSWSTARGLLLNMTLKGKIEAEKTTKSLIFRLPKKDPAT